MVPSLRCSSFLRTLCRLNILQASASISICVSPFISLIPPPAIQIGSTLRFALTMQMDVAAALRATSSHPHIAAYVVSSVKEGAVLVLEALGTGSYSYTLTFEG
jgi:hypothetical protein